MRYPLLKVCFYPHKNPFFLSSAWSIAQYIEAYIFDTLNDFQTSSITYLDLHSDLKVCCAHQQPTTLLYTILSRSNAFFPLLYILWKDSDDYVLCSYMHAVCPFILNSDGANKRWLVFFLLFFFRTPNIIVLLMLNLTTFRHDVASYH
jgi:hypothetical protein